MPTPTTLAALAPTADLNRRLFGGTGYGWSPADEHARLTAQLARLDAEIARCDAEIARVRAERSAALLPLLGLAAVGQRIADIDADRAESARAAEQAVRAPVNPAALAPFAALAAAVAFVAILGYLASTGYPYDALHAAAHSCLHDQAQLVAGDPADIFESLAAAAARVSS